MPYDPLREVRAHLQQYLLGAISLPDFHLWFVRWRRANLDDERHPLARMVDLRLAEYTTGHWTEPQLRERLLAGSGLGSTTVSFAPTTDRDASFEIGYTQRREPEPAGPAPSS